MRVSFLRHPVQQHATGSGDRSGRELARDEYRRSGRRLRVEIPGPSLPIVLARYAEDAALPDADALAA